MSAISDDERTPISDMKTLDEQDERDVIHGYLAGLNGREEPGVEFNRAYWHGWRNGMADKGRIPVDGHMQKLAAEYLDRSRRARIALEP